MELRRDGRLVWEIPFECRGRPSTHAAKGVYVRRSRAPALVAVTVG